MTWFTANDSGGTPIALAADSLLRVEWGGNPLLRAKLTLSAGATAVVMELHYGAELLM